MSAPDSRLVPCLIGGALIAALAWAAVSLGTRHSPAWSPFAGWAACGVALFVSVALAATAPTRRRAWRRLLVVAALLAFVTAWVAWGAAPFGPSGEAIQGARAENAPGMSMFLLLAMLMMSVLGPVALVLLGLALSLLAWLSGREPRLRRMRP